MQRQSYADLKEIPNLIAASPEALAEQYLIGKVRRTLTHLFLDERLDSIIRKKILVKEDYDDIFTIYAGINDKVFRDEMAGMRDKLMEASDGSGITYSRSISSARKRIWRTLYGDRPTSDLRVLGDYVLCDKTPPAEFIVKELRGLKGVKSI